MDGIDGHSSQMKKSVWPGQGSWLKPVAHDSLQATQELGFVWSIGYAGPLQFWHPLLELYARKLQAGQGSQALAP